MDYNNIGDQATEVIVSEGEQITFTDNTYTHIIKWSNAEGITGTDLRIGLDDTNQSLVICKRTDIDTDWGQVQHNLHPCLWIYRTANEYQVMTPTHNVYTSHFSSKHHNVCKWKFQATLASDHAFEFLLESGDGLTDTDGHQAWLALTPGASQSNTAACDVLYIDISGISATGDGSAGYGNNFINCVDTSVSKFKVANDGTITTTGGEVSYGANDSAGAGYRTVRVPNT